MERSLPPPWDRFVPVLEKVFVWLLFFVVLWFLRPFFLLVFLAFVFGFIQAHGVDLLKNRIRTRWVASVFVFVCLLLGLLALGFTVGPPLAAQAQAFPDEVRRNLAKLDERIEKLRADYPWFKAGVPDDLNAREIVVEVFDIEQRPSPAFAEGPEEAVPRPNVLPKVIALLQKSFAVGTSFLLALLFSFLIVLDLPKIAKGIASLHDTRLRFVYEEVSDSIYQFGKILGRALEAQLLIAILNTCLTAIGLAFMQLPNVVFLSAAVFVCSFIPVAGVFISSIPICLAALTVSGFELMLVAIAFITVIHMIEAYILNPRIYGAHLRMNPVLVLAILVISHHLVGMWGLILGVPVVNFVVRYVIHERASLDRTEAQAA